MDSNENAYFNDMIWSDSCDTRWVDPQVEHEKLLEPLTQHDGVPEYYTQRHLILAKIANSRSVICCGLVC